MATTALAMSIGSMLSSSAAPRIVVPRLQRPYSWGSSELAELWNDISEFHERNPGDTLAGREYFLGSIVAKHIEGADPQYEILDGQQRLATITILLSVIRDSLEEIEPDDASNLQITHIAKKRGPGKAVKYVLTLNGIDADFFRDTIQKRKSAPLPEPATPSQRLILRAQTFFQGKIQQYLEQKTISRIELLERLQMILLENFRIVLISSTNIDYVTDVFERLNDRGKGLSTLDLLRTLLIGRAKDESSQAEVDTSWYEIYELSDSASTVESFLRHSWITRNGDVKSRALYKEIKRSITDKTAPKTLSDPIEFSADLASDAVLYKRIVNGEHQDGECARWLRAISTLGASALLPCALSAAAVQMKNSDHAKVLRALITAYVRYNVVGGGESTVLESCAYKAAMKLRASGGDAEAALIELRPLLNSDAVFRSNFAELTVSRVGYQRHILEELEYFLTTKHSGTSGSPEKIVGGSGVLWIEHVYPQKPDATWGKWTDHNDIINRIGNLTLIHKKLNSTMKNRVFELKKPDLAASNLSLNAYFADRKGWHRSDIDRRQRELAKLVGEIWPRF